MNITLGFAHFVNRKSSAFADSRIETRAFAEVYPLHRQLSLLAHTPMLQALPAFRLGFSDVAIAEW